MKGFIYISGVFTTVVRSDCKVVTLDNDPHFWEMPPTWGICRYDLRENALKDDYVFFVLPRKANLPQMIYGYMKIAEIISHSDAYHRPELSMKRMGNKNPNGNIIVDELGEYNRFDVNVHKPNFDKIKRRYAIGYEKESEFFTPLKIRRLAPKFPIILNQIFGGKEKGIFELITQSGRIMSSRQVIELLDWLAA